MTFTNFLQVLAFNLLSNTIPLCLLLLATAYFAIRIYEKRLDRVIDKKISKMFENYNTDINTKSRKRALVDED
jgi:hypothetical protein